MGNLAAKCDTQCNAKRSDLRCVGSSPTLDVRVLRTDGSEAEEFDRPVVAAEVMLQFPEYAVVQWCPTRDTKLGKRGQMRVLQRHDVLTPGKTYVLFPIPPEVTRNLSSKGHASRRTRRVQSSKDNLAQLLQRAGVQTGGDPSLPPLPPPPASDANRPELEKVYFPVFDHGRGADSSNEEKGETQEEPKPYSHPGFHNWRPALLSIPESPIGFHSRPESPMTPIAFRIVSVRERDP